MEDQEKNLPRILIVDDNLKNVQVLGKFLQNEGFEVEFALDGHSALEWIRKQNFDLVLLDIMMPGMNGYQVCDKIKQDQANKDLPVIFLTAKTDQESIIEGFEKGAVDYILKPFIKNELLARVKTHLEIKLSRDRLSSYLSEIEDKTRNITASINYAKKIQEAILENKEINKAILPEHFIFFLPRDIVSGDFYWFAVQNEKVIIAIMDGTGHGVPGALMGILGVMLLNEIVLGERILKPDLIINNLKAKLIRSLGQKANSDGIRDGIEGAVISFDIKKNELEYAGSFNPLILIRDGVLSEIKADRIPIGCSDLDGDFTNKTIKIKKDDLFYLFTDGYIDQFGGPDKKRYMLKRLKSSLLSIHKLPLISQKEELFSILNEWRGTLEQIDDILVFGIRF